MIVERPLVLGQSQLGRDTKLGIDHGVLPSTTLLALYNVYALSVQALDGLRLVFR